MPSGVHSVSVSVLDIRLATSRIGADSYVVALAGEFDLHASEGVRARLSEVLEAILEDRIDAKKATALTYTMQVVAYNLRTGVNFEPPAEQMVRDDPAEHQFEADMKMLPQNASVPQVLKVLKTYAKG